ncbi:M14 family metallopeptidase [Cyclobacterium qasimii]|uniref:Peptidase M14 domain-containing protein n=1 Tax=Cyclobacterium qasimii M12-11B TaxID=641524 RepID=S7V8L2_9BACT|nr:M14 metallopeptidase family protein [Cyclobacterium qasimii]EPR65912.1 hypothetical protein ADICYQ_5057 [Cyclobacterium qasimii M12-11B]
MKTSSGISVLFIVILFLCYSCQPAKESTDSIPPALLEDAYAKYKAPEIDNRRYGYEVIAPLIAGRKEIFETTVLGESVEGRPINALTYGEGTRKVLLWSQMHGNESTATMALFDLFNFLEGSADDGFESIRSALRENLLLRFIPMLNPDGAEKFVRRNAQQIDLNRDAVRQSTPEGFVLKTARDDFEPEFGFNLHDQNRYYNVEGTALPATISFLAPAYNEDREVNAVRSRAMKVIAGMDQLLQQVIPGQVGKYDDSFEPRAFGDNIQKWGTSTILIESGAYSGDREKQYIRQLNFMILLNALYEIATGSFDQYTEEAYHAIPENDSKLMDLLIKNVETTAVDKKYLTDIGIKSSEVFLDSVLVLEGSIADWGDLSVYYGHEEIEAKGMTLEKGEIWPEVIPLEQLDSAKVLQMLKEGYLAVATEMQYQGQVHQFPILIFTEGNAPNMHPDLDDTPLFYLSAKGKRI